MTVHLSGGRKERHTVGQRSLVLRAWVAERRGRVWGVSIEGANVPRAGNTVSILHPLSLRSLAYFYSSLSETWVGSSPFPLEEFFLLLSLPVLLPPPPTLLFLYAASLRVPSGYRCGDNNMQTFWYLQFECHKTGTGNRGEEAPAGARLAARTRRSHPLQKVHSSLFY